MIAIRPLRAATSVLVAAASLALVAGPAAAATDPYRSQQWSLDRIGAPTAWTVAQGAGQVVAVIDSGIDLGHPDLVERLYRDANGAVVGHDFVEDDDVPQDLLGHGSMVAGVIAAETDNGFGVASVAPQAQIMPVRVLDENGEGYGDDVDAGIRWAVDHGATIVNLSLESEDLAVAGASSGTLNAPVAAVRYAWDHGVIVVAAAGNSGSQFTDYPPTSPVVLVGATDRNDERAGFSDSGRTDLLMAPGVDIVSTWCRPPGSDACDPETHNFGIAEGTSFAAPHVAGALAVLRSMGLDAQAAVDRLRSTARDLGAPGRDLDTGYGLIDLVAATGATTASPTPSATATSPPATTTTPSPSPSPSSPETTATPSSPSASPSPSATTDPSPSGTTTEPSPPGPVATSAPPSDPTAAGGAGDGAGRGAWPMLAVALVLATGVAVGRTWSLRQPR